MLLPPPLCRPRRSWRSLPCWPRCRPSYSVSAAGLSTGPVDQYLQVISIPLHRSSRSLGSLRPHCCTRGPTLCCTDPSSCMPIVRLTPLPLLHRPLILPITSSLKRNRDPPPHLPLPPAHPLSPPSLLLFFSSSPSPSDLVTSTAMSFINKWALQLLPLPTTLLVLQVCGGVIAWGFGCPPSPRPSRSPSTTHHIDGAAGVCGGG